jgi:hypothetical protein
MDVDRLLADEDAGWRALHQAFDAIPRERLDEPGVTPDGWTAKDVMFHVGAWCAECGNQLERIRLGTYLTHDWETDRKNREWFETSRRLDIPTVQAEITAAHARMLQEWAALGEITPPAWEWLEESGPLHYAEHLRDIHAWLESGAVG